MSHYGYYVDLESIRLQEGKATWIQAMTLGTYDHALYGKITFTPERVQRFAQGVKDRVRTTDLDIDYDHKEYSGEAAGWIKDAEARSDGLWVLVEWTKKAYDLIKDGAYRYFSPDYYDEWVHTKSGVKFKDVLFGGAITNRPHLRDILPINLKEIWETAIDISEVTERQDASWPPKTVSPRREGSYGPEEAQGASWPPRERF